MSSQGGTTVESAIWARVYPGQILWTPGRGYPQTGQRDFTVTEVNNTGIKFSKLAATVVSWAALDSAVSALRNAGGTAEIGGYNGWAAVGTFERFLQDARGNNTRTSTYVVPMLVEAGIVEYVAQPGRKGIRLT